MSNAEEKVRKGIAKLLLSRPFYADILLQLELVEDPEGLPFNTMGTDGRKLYYSSEFVEKCSTSELQGVLAHEATHIAALHPLRKEARNPMLWNIAADTEVNQVVVELDGMQLPEGCVKGKSGTAEEHYAKLMKEAMQHSCKGEGCGHSSHGDGEGWCRVLPPDLKPGESFEDFKAEVTEKVRTAATRAQMAGKMPAGLDRFVSEMLQPKIPWEEVLRRFVESKLEPRIDWNSPSRRYLNRGLVLPGNSFKRALCEIAVAPDTSGSMTGEIFDRACAEVIAVIEGVYKGQSEIPVIWFDHAAYLQHVKSKEELEPKGGGGTSFRVVMECVEEEELNVKGLVVITDGYCGDFGEDPGIPVLWVVFDEYAKQFSPPFGEVIQLD